MRNKREERGRDGGERDGVRDFQERRGEVSVEEKYEGGSEGERERKRKRLKEGREKKNREKRGEDKRGITGEDNRKSYESKGRKGGREKGI